MKLDATSRFLFCGALFVLLCAAMAVFVGCSQDVPPPDNPGLKIDIDISRPPEWSPVESLDEFSDDYLRATCRVKGGGSGGSGTCYKIDSNYVYVLTARHVVGGAKTFQCEFWINGKITGKYTGEVVRVLDVDAAVIAIPVGAFKDNELPVAIPISRTPPDVSRPIISVGCPALRWQSLFEGHITEYPGSGTRHGAKSFEFQPPPTGGRSGAGIIQDRKIVGVLWGSTGKSGSGSTGEGYAVNCMDLQGLVEKRGMFFTAGWCTYCQEMKPVIANLDGIKVIDCDRNASFAQMLGVNKLPAYVNEAGEVMYGVKTEDELREFYQ